MTRRRSTPWIHRWSRPLIGAIATLGILNTGYLTYEKLFSSAVGACPTGGCDKVLNSPYGTVFGQPLSLFGLLAYFAMAVFALAPLAVTAENARSLRKDLEDKTWLLLFVGATAMLLFSGYLMYIMFSKFVAEHGVKGICWFCIASAIFALLMFILTLVGREWDDRGNLFFTGTIVAITTLLVTLGVYNGVGNEASNSAYTISDSAGNAYFVVDNSSGEAEIGLAKHLKSINAKMYGAYWCPHCCEQKEFFGKEALQDFNYAECAEGGKDVQTAACQQVADTLAKQGKKMGFPTWEINGQYYSQRLTPQELAQYSGYKGPQNFKNTFKVCRQP